MKSTPRANYVKLFVIDFGFGLLQKIILNSHKMFVVGTWYCSKKFYEIGYCTDLFVPNLTLFMLSRGNIAWVFSPNFGTNKCLN